MEEIKVGEYCRYDDGTIIKVVEEEESLYNYLLKNKKGLFKHSPNIIELIEEGDYVNGMEVLDIHKPRDLWEPIEIRVDSRYTNFILAEDIKTILTKEQFEINCYKMEEEE